jgi:hypothetical protein
MSSPGSKNNSLYQKLDFGYIEGIPSQSEGRRPIVTTRGGDAVDVEVPLTRGAKAYGKSVWSRRRGAGVNAPWAQCEAQVELRRQISRSPGRVRHKP